MNLQEAGDAPRFHHTGLIGADRNGDDRRRRAPPRVRRRRPTCARELLRRGHRIVETTGRRFGGYQAIWRDPVSGVYFGATESRKDGLALGY